MKLPLKVVNYQAMIYKTEEKLGLAFEIGAKFSQNTYK